MLLTACLPSFAQQASEWQPTGEWPFVNKKFLYSTIYSGFFKLTKTKALCNIHVGNQTLWYVQNDTLMEALPGSIIRVEFPDSSVYVPIGDNRFGRVVHQDSVGRIICSRVVDRAEMERDAASRNLSAFTLSGNGLFPTMTLNMMENYVSNPDEMPLPMKNEFYFLYNKELFQVTEKNIIDHIDKSRKREFKAFTRSAEIIMQNESSIKKIWDNFFLKRSPGDSY
jgi:hypothetical protein